MDVPMDTYEKLIPHPTRDTQPHWDGLNEHKYLLQKCTACGKIRHYPRPVCEACYSMDAEWIEASGHGRIHSWTITHHPFHPGWKGDLPYIMVTADLDEGVRMNAQLRGAGPEALKTGAKVQIDYELAKPGLTLPVLKLVD
jgi:uncharacterized protein